MKFWKYSRVALALMGSVVLGMSITCCGVYTSGYMYVTGAQYNQIGAYKIDHDFGYLTPVTGSPFATAGADPMQEAVIPGGRFLAVVTRERGVADGSVSIYTIGGAGVLYLQATYATSGINPVSMTVSPDGNYLYIVDQLAPDGSGRGDITVFQINPTTGKLTLITNANTFNTNGSQLPYFEVNYNPVQVITGSALHHWCRRQLCICAGSRPIPTGSVRTPAGMRRMRRQARPASTPDVFLYQINTSTGQLTLTQNAPLILGTLPGAASTHLLAAVANTSGLPILPTAANSGRILPFTIGGGGVLQTLVGGPVPNNLPTSAYPDAILSNSNSSFPVCRELRSGTYHPAEQQYFRIYDHTTNGQLTASPFFGSNLFQPDAGPVWMVLDSTSQYLYTANYNDNTITGKVIGADQRSADACSKGTGSAYGWSANFLWCQRAHVLNAG